MRKRRYVLKPTNQRMSLPAGLMLAVWLMVEKLHWKGVVLGIWIAAYALVCVIMLAAYIYDLLCAEERDVFNGEKPI
jgi:hypothetical protein